VDIAEIFSRVIIVSGWQREVAMRPALLSEKLPDSVVRCHTCQWHCVIHPDKTGICRMYQNKDGILYNLNYALVSSLATDPIEKKPLFHFHPGTMVYSLGGWGCNFHCEDCQNWEISMAQEVMSDSREILPEKVIELAKHNHCDGIAWTYNEPSVWFEFTLDCAKLARKNGLYTIYVTNGFLTSEALDIIGPYLDAWRVDIKGFTDDAYRSLAKVTNWRGILEVAERARNKWKMHVEVVTNIVPKINDDDEQLVSIARWIYDKLGEMTPWHVTRFHPQFNMSDLPPTPIGILERAYDIGRKAGLKYVYIGNVPGHGSETTVCHNCGKPVVERFGYETVISGLDGSCCRYCGIGLNFRT
jgi:pyruvate formate lyase activating enzyme